MTNISSAPGFHGREHQPVGAATGRGVARGPAQERQRGLGPDGQAEGRGEGARGGDTDPRPREGPRAAVHGDGRKAARANAGVEAEAVDPRHEGPSQLPAALEPRLHDPVARCQGDGRDLRRGAQGQDHPSLTASRSRAAGGVSG